MPGNNVRRWLPFFPFSACRLREILICIAPSYRSDLDVAIMTTQSANIFNTYFHFFHMVKTVFIHSQKMHNLQKSHKFSILTADMTCLQHIDFY